MLFKLPGDMKNPSDCGPGLCIRGPIEVAAYHQKRPGPEKN